MTQLLNLVPILLAIVCYVLAGVFGKDPSVRDGLLLTAGALGGWAIPRLGSDIVKKGAAPTTMLLLAVSLTFGASACKTTPAIPDNFYQAVVTCTQDNSTNTQAGAAVLRCLTGAVNSDYSACLAGLVTAGYWTVDEVACIVRRYATASAQRLNAGTADSTDEALLANSNAWLRQKQITFKGAAQ